MAFFVQAQRYVNTEREPLPYGLYAWVELPDGSFVWDWKFDGEPVRSDRPFPGVPMITRPGMRGGRLVSQDEAEEITGLSAPVCWDKIRDLM